MKGVVYTIGHSNHPPHAFIELLKGAGIGVVVDARSQPGSRWASYTRPDELKRILKAAGIKYLYMGDVLGGRPNGLPSYDPQAEKPHYASMQHSEAFQQGLSRLLEGAVKYRVCIMCAEENPSVCHRNFLIGEALRRRGVKLLHIRGDGQIQTDEELSKEKAGVPTSQLLLPF